MGRRNWGWAVLLVSLASAAADDSDEASSATATAIQLVKKSAVSLLQLQAHCTCAAVVVYPVLAEDDRISASERPTPSELVVRRKPPPAAHRDPRQSHGTAGRQHVVILNESCGFGETRFILKKVVPTPSSPHVVILYRTTVCSRGREQDYQCQAVSGPNSDARTVP